MLEATAQQIAEAVLLRRDRRAAEATACYDPAALRQAMRKLACAVLRQALVDASGQFAEAKKNGYQSEAQHFLLDPARDEEFAFWCRLAGVSATKARERLQKQTYSLG